MPFSASKDAPRGCKTDLSQEERDQRTIFVMQLANRTRPRELGLFIFYLYFKNIKTFYICAEDFFSAVGTVRDVRIITDSKTRRSKGIAYVEFWEVEAVPLVCFSIFIIYLYLFVCFQALGLNGQKLVGAPLVIQPTQAERNRAFNSMAGAPLG
jgi:RNA-binding protein 39